MDEPGRSTRVRIRRFASPASVSGRHTYRYIKEGSKEAVYTFVRSESEIPASVKDKVSTGCKLELEQEIPQKTSYARTDLKGFWSRE